MLPAALPAWAQSITPQPSAGPTQYASHTAVLAAHYSPALDPTLASEEAASAGLPLPKYGGWVSVTKWLTLASSVGLGTAGILLAEDADDLFLRLQVACGADPDNCRSREPDGSYSDPLLEELYQSTVSKDQQARAAFIGAQVSFGASVLLFIVDFQRDKGPSNVPYDPDKEQPKLQISAVPGELAVRYYLQ